MSMPATERCRGCNAVFVWAKTTRARGIPIDAVRDPTTDRWVPLEVDNGTVRDTGRTTWGTDGQRIPVVEIGGAGSGRWRPHFATCPKAKQFRHARGGKARRNNPAVGGR